MPLAELMECLTMNNSILAYKINRTHVGVYG